MSPTRPRRRPGRLTVVIGLAVLAVVGVNGLVVVPFARNVLHNRTVNSPSYKAKYGHWDTISLPKKLRVNAVHATLLNTGKILITAGSGNDQAQFKARSFKTLIYDPATGSSRLIYTPSDLFCNGQTVLANGDVLIAGGTETYEVLAKKVTHAGGIMTVRNESPAPGLRVIPMGTEFVGTNGQKYRTDAEIIVQPAVKKQVGHQTTVLASHTTVWVNAETTSGDAQLNLPAPGMHFAITGIAQADAHNVYGMATRMDFLKQDYHGSAFSYLFDPQTEEYTRVPNLTTKRWYPTLTSLSDGSVLAVGGLDGNGQIVGGTNETEQWNPQSKQWVRRPELNHYFPTYPALLQTAQPNVVFYTSGNTGYGPLSKGRQPGFWNVVTNAFTPVPGLRDAADNETSSSAWIGPLQNQTVAVVGGGGVGESRSSTGRIDVIKLNAPHPHFVAGPSLPKGTRYAQLVTLPDDTMLITNGSQYYRGEHGSDNHVARIYHPDTNSLSYAADPTIGRDYHSEALLLPDGRVITMGGNPLYGDKRDSTPGGFEQRLEIYTPAYLYRGSRPTVTSASSAAPLGGTITAHVAHAVTIASARLIRPGAATHDLNLEQASIALPVKRGAGDALQLTLPTSPAIVRPGSYLLFLVDSAGVPSIAHWVTITAPGGQSAG